MEKEIIKNMTCEKNRLVIDLGENRNISMIQAKSSKPLISAISIKYALNNITSDLIELDREPWSTTDVCFLFKLEPPVCASHIFVYGDENDINSLTVELSEPDGMSDDARSLDCYPKYFDFDLAENYSLNKVSVVTEGDGTADFDVYLSLDGRNFYLLSEEKSRKVGTVCDIKVNLSEARIIRVYLKYASKHNGCNISDVKMQGVKSGSPKKELPKINVPEFKGSEYDVEIKDKDTCDAVYGIIERSIGAEYISWFELNIAASKKYDFFELSDNGGRILIKGSNGVSLAVGLNHYLKYYCKVNISQVGNQTKMPSSIVSVGEPVRRETKAKIRYAYNYCTLSYSMAFWGEAEWQKELDWLALNGVNLILDTTAQEEVWRRFLTKVGYSHRDIKDFLVGPAYYAWAYMANTTNIGGPLHDSWFEKRTELARKNHLFMRKMGMHPILQGFSGMMPLDIKKYDPDIDILDQGLWCASLRPPMIRTTSDCYKKYAELFYRAQREVYGNYSSYYATDPFHEGGKVGDMKPREISSIILTEMLRENKNTVWIVQSWQGNPTSEFLAGISDVSGGKDHLLVLDLYAEKNPNYLNGRPENPDHGYAPEFDGTPWIFCMLNNFGGRLGLYGHLDNLVNNIPHALNTAKNISGVGITPEASENNPVLYEFLFDCIWQDNAGSDLPVLDIDKWLREYSIRRYGMESKNAIEAWDCLKNTVYKAECNMLGQGATESIINARPAFDIKTASAWGNAIIGYDRCLLEKALELLERDYELLKHSDGYMYDLTSVRLQVISNRVSEYPPRLKRHFEEKDIEGFKKTADEFLKTAYEMDAAANMNRYYTLDRCLKMAEKLADGTDDLTKYLYPFNAKAQITTWGEYSRAEIGCLHDYSNRIWSGLMKDFYIPRWERWLKARTNELEGKPFEKNIDWYEMEWHWVTGRK